MGRPVALYRAPWGHRGPGLRYALCRLGWKNIGWRFAARDWRATTSAEVARRVTASARARDIVLLHDAGPGAEWTAAALPVILEGLESRGFSLEAYPSHGLSG
jgi:peptidoglycan/xylan/chitin deacetylase (PgdA/CDA1 family)